jgi:hypothetical protein
VLNFSEAVGHIQLSHLIVITCRVDIFIYCTTQVYSLTTLGNSSNCFYTASMVTDDTTSVNKIKLDAALTYIHTHTHTHTYTLFQINDSTISQVYSQWNFHERHLIVCYATYRDKLPSAQLFITIRHATIDDTF